MKLTPEQIEQNGEAVKAHQRGEPVVVCTIDPICGLWNWSPFIYDKWDFDLFTYRPAPKPEPPKPWDMNTCPKLPFEVLRRDKQIRTIVDAATSSRVGLGNGAMLSYQELLAEYTLTDGSPCGATK